MTLMQPFAVEKEDKYLKQSPGIIKGCGPDRMTDELLALPHLWTY